MLQDFVRFNRSYRKFDESRPITTEELLAWLETARFTASSINAQPLKFLYCNSSQANARLFPLLAWARLLKDYPGPAEGARPTAYVLICIDSAVNSNTERFQMDVGIAAQTILLAAAEAGVGGCMIANFSKPKLSQTLALPENLQPSLVLALGQPAEEIVLEDAEPGAATPYYRDAAGRHHVPKRQLTEIALDWNK